MKRLSSILITFLITLVFLSPVSAQVESEDQSIEDFLHQYFNARYSNMIQESPKSDLDRFISINANSQWKNLENLRQLALDRIAFDFKIQYDGYEFKLDILKISIEKNLTTVVLLESATVNYINLTMPPFQVFDIEHTLTLQNESNSWKIINDSYEDIFTMQVRGMSEETLISTIDEKLVAQDKKRPSFLTTLPKSYNLHKLLYNRAAAVDYARNW